MVVVLLADTSNAVIWEIRRLQSRRESDFAKGLSCRFSP
jgi:hypothetical protein